MKSTCPPTPEWKRVPIESAQTCPVRSICTAELMAVILGLRAMTYGSLVDTPQFQLIYKAEILGQTFAEIARDLGISEVACKKRAERARKYLQKKLKNEVTTSLSGDPITYTK